MTVTQIPGENRYWVSSESHPEGPPHTVDLAERVDQYDKSHPACSCWRYMCYGEMCKHIVALVEHLKPHENQTH